MGYNITKPLVVANASGLVSLLSLLIAAGYQGPSIVQVTGYLQNMDAAIDCYIHFTSSNDPGLLTETDGIPFGPTAGLSSGFILAKGDDLSTTFLYAASGSITIQAAIRN